MPGRAPAPGSSRYNPPSTFSSPWLAASHADSKVDGGLYLLEPGTGALPGMRLN